MPFKADIQCRPDRQLSDGHGWEQLAAAIIETACDDYRIAIVVEDRATMKRLEKFFRSKYFNIISYINPDWLIVKLKERADKDKKDGKKYKPNPGQKLP